MPTRPAANTRATTPTECRLYLEKAAQFLEAAESSLDAGNNIAAVGNAVHAGIAAADAIAGVRSGTVWRGPHGQAPAHVEKVAGSDGRQASRQLRRLMPLKNRAEYDPTPVARSQATGAVQSAKRLMEIARGAVDSLTS